MSTQFNFIWPIDSALGATIPEPGSDSYDGLLCIPQSSSITETSTSDCLVLYLGHALGESYPSTEMQSVYFATLAD